MGAGGGWVGGTVREVWDPVRSRWRRLLWNFDVWRLRHETGTRLSGIEVCFVDPAGAATETLGGSGDVVGGSDPLRVV